MSKPTVKHTRHDGVTHNVDSAYNIVFDRCTPFANGTPRDHRKS